jgi:GT2 family glycosyltransferase
MSDTPTRPGTPDDAKTGRYADSVAISVVVPTYNRALKLARLLAALSSYPPPDGGFEVIVIDDGSTDQTASAVQGVDLPVIYEHQANGGPAAARNRGWRKASAPIVAFIDDDCVPDPQWLPELLKAFLANPAVAGVGGSIRALRPGFLHRFVTAERLFDHGRDDEVVRFLVTGNAAYRRAALVEVGGFDETMRPSAEDTDLSYRVRDAVGPLMVCESAAVEHEFSGTWRVLFETYFRAGRGRAMLSARHPELSVSAGAQKVVALGDWTRRYRRYRAVGASPFGSIASMGLRIAGLGAFLSGTMFELLR